MCGIIGIFNEKEGTAKKKIIKGLKAIENRGRDGFGLSNGSWTEFSKELNKLSKGDEDKNLIGHALHSVVNFIPQPILGEEKNRSIVANCEIYNWKELNQRYGLDAQNDSQLIIKLIEKKGIQNVRETIEELDGDFAFAYWNENNVYLARDIVGVKPLWFCLDSENNNFAFASEKKALKEMGFQTEKIEELNPREIIHYSIQKNKIEKIKRDFFSIKPEITKNEFLIKRETKELLIEAIRKRLPQGKFGILFSGGIDSTFIAYVCKFILKREDFICYTAAFGPDNEKDSEEAEDLRFAQKASKEYKFKLKVKKINLDETEKCIRKIIPLIEDNNVVKVGVALPFFVACEETRKDNIKVIFSGLGSEEIFAGYERHKNSIDVNKECQSGILKLYERDTYRDDVITMNNNLELRVPFMDKQLIAYALKIPAKYKLNEENENAVENKIILRRISEEIGMKKEFYERKKKAAQYGSRFDKALEKLAKKNKFKLKSDYLKQFYDEGNTELGVLFSSGKDSCFAMWTMMKQNYKIKCLITIESKNPDSYMFHTPNIQLAKKQAEAMDIPILTIETQGEKEKELYDLDIAMKEAIKKYNIKGIVTGALFSNYQRERIEKLCDKNSLKIFSPLWHMDQEKEMRSLLKADFEFILSSVAAEGLDKKWLGRKITEKDVDKLVELNKKTGINIAFEGGEAESLVLDAPMFKKKLKILESEIIMENQNTGRFIVKKAELVDKQ
ncbi:MAG: diphthine--ammonia ligase [Nanoarchaeota archaeon]|nr:diphthine--ammonia ligase [Nanoarchaeota archaeon]